ncbi:LysR family transcriptional regulator [Solimicrobium silvestre]|uniref:Transcriptional regulator n=1 Tax=Solimicrobium silvestre TaxID=2099400 RepID=A0A2S9H3Z8_9BURK|nr:LysR family transcriptional regulator [Solimicrobium silvestre]PRC94698.1 Transcriptional regulator [Solimicrobium silvestre]
MQKRLTTEEPSWELYRSFLAVARLGSLSAAARSLDTTQPTIGRHIEALEMQLKTALFSRSPVGLVPNAIALELIPHAETMAAAAEALIRRASGEAGKEHGTVRITASTIVGGEVLPGLLAPFHRQYPEITLELVLTNEPEDMLRRDADIAIRMFRPTQGALIARRVGPVAVGLYVHRSYAEVIGLPKRIDQLDGHTLIGYDRNPFAIHSAQQLGIQLSRDQFNFRCDNELAQLSALRAGIGIGACQKPIAARDQNLLPVLPKVVALELDMWLVMHEDMRNCRRIMLLFNYLKDGLATYCKGTS